MRGRPLGHAKFWDLETAMCKSCRALSEVSTQVRNVEIRGFLIKVAGKIYAIMAAYYEKAFSELQMQRGNTADLCLDRERKNPKRGELV